MLQNGFFVLIFCPKMLWCALVGRKRSEKFNWPASRAVEISRHRLWTRFSASFQKGLGEMFEGDSEENVRRRISADVDGWLSGQDLLACTTWFHQSQVYQPIYTKLIYTELICTKPHFYHPPNMVARTRESSPSRATRAQGRPLMIFAFGKNHSASFLLFPDPRGKFRVWYRWVRYRWGLVKPRFGKDEG